MKTLPDPPREVVPSHLCESSRLTAKILGGLIIGILLCGCFLSYCYWSPLEERGLVTQARVTGQETKESGGRSSSTHYYMKLYVEDKVQQQFEEEVSQNSYDAVATGQAITVTVSPDQPFYLEIGHVEHGRTWQVMCRWLIGAGAVLLILNLILRWQAKRFATHKKILEEWPEASGKIINVSIIGGKSATVNIYYEFTVDAVPYRGGFSVSRGSFSPGGQVPVLYDPTDPKRNFRAADINFAAIRKS